METEILEKGRQYIREGKYEKAQIILRRALDENPNRARVLELCGDLAIKLGKVNEAVSRYEHAFENYTHNGQYAEAVICLEKILMADEMNDSVLFRLVDLYHFYGLRNEALKRLIEFASRALEKKDETLFVSALRKVVEFQPKNLPLRLSLAKLLFSINRNREAQDELVKLKSLASEINDETILNEIRKLMPQTDGGEELDPRSRIELGNLLYEIGSRDEAIVEFKKASDDLIREGKVDDAVNVLNRILEIDPNNSEALKKLNELKPGAKPKIEEKIEIKTAKEPEKPSPVSMETTEEVKSEVPPSVQQADETITAIQSDLEILKDLSKEIEGFAFPSEIEKERSGEVKSEEKITEEPPVEQVPEVKPAEIPPLEGQIADIEFLLKESEVSPTPRNFEVAKQFDDFRTNITWEIDDTKKKIPLARMAVESGLFEIALSYLQDEKEKKEFWPASLEIVGESLIKLGRYNEAIKVIGPVILLEEIPENEKTELRYLLASGYEGIGDFENALREIEHILAINPDYRDIREIYTLLGGKMEITKPQPVAPVVEEKTPVTEPVQTKEQAPPVEPIVTSEKVEEVFYQEPEVIVEKPIEEISKPVVEEPLIEERIPVKEGYPEEGKMDVEEKTDNIAFL
ncbi:MAG: tetratricopeptide repeat protein [candidate division WOR-3 bacterium]